MQQVREWRNRPARLNGSLNDSRQWFQMGMISATVLTPLLSRWRALRAAERARELWEMSQAGTRWPWAHPVAEEHPPPLARRQVRTGLWLAGVSVGLVAAGTTAYLVARRRLRAEEEPLELPLISRAGANGSHDAASAASGPRPTTARTPAPAVSAGERSATQTPTPAASGASAEDVSAETDQPSGARPAPEPPPAPLFVGNTRTLTYTPADGDDPPPEDVRIYFASEEQAIQAGYRLTPRAPRRLERDAEH